jgi:hypothetical protein
MKQLFTFCLVAVVLLSACTGKQSSQKNLVTMIQRNEKVVSQTLDSLKARYPDLNVPRAEKGLRQAASLWTDNDGPADAFMAFCLENYVHNPKDREALFVALSDKLELLYGHFHQIDLGLKVPLQETGNDPQKIDFDLGGYDVAAHFKDDMFGNKVAFTVIINFPSYSLQEKTEQGAQWSRLEWACARLGDQFASRIPADVLQEVAVAESEAENYIADYNIMMGELRNDQNEALFPKGMSLISHWNLRDELKSNYADTDRGLEKQRMIYTVMKRIVTQQIPEKVINNAALQWNPINNKVYENGTEIPATPEPDTRFARLLNNYRALALEDPCTPVQPTYIRRAFEGDMEFLKEDVKEMFTQFVSSPQVAQVAALIETRLGRKLEPFDIWYDGFKSRSSIPEDALTTVTQKRYPDAQAFERALPDIMHRLGFSSSDAQRISQKVQVDPARGSGHAWGAVMKGDKAHLRTRIPEKGMDYKGYNIAMHEFGHNVEQTISLYDVDYYTMNGVPNTAFTEALAFIFQKRDLDVLGMSEKNPDKQYLEALDIFWGCYEIMGVSLVDMEVWEWMYAHPQATPAQLKENVLRIATEVWNAYYAPVLGETDSPILAIYSHMINSPLYLSNYPMGHLIEFQLEAHLRGKDFAAEVLRIYKMGRLIPQLWMKQATGHEVSIAPMLKAASEAVEKLKTAR